MKDEDYVSIEVAKLLKEKGFNEPTSRVYHDGNIYDISYCRYGHDVFGGDFYLIPTLYEAQKWLRKQGVFIEIRPFYSRKYEIIEYDYRIATYFDLLDMQGKRIRSKERHEKYEECLNTAIFESLKLIQL